MSSKKNQSAFSSPDYMVLKNIRCASLNSGANVQFLEKFPCHICWSDPHFSESSVLCRSCGHSSLEEKFLSRPLHLSFSADKAYQLINGYLR